MNIFVILVCGILAAVLVPKGALTGGELAAAYGIWFAVGAWLGTAFRLLPPKTAHVITFLGTFVIGVVRTGINLTLPWPLGWQHTVVPLETQHLPFKVQIKGSDELVFDIPGAIQYQVVNPVKFAFERDEPIKQMAEIVMPAIRTTGNSLGFQAIYGDKGAFMEATEGPVATKLATFGIQIVDIPIQDPELSETTRLKMNSIAEARFGEQAATHDAIAIKKRMVGAAEAEAESLRIKSEALNYFRLKTAEGNAGAIAVMQGKIGLTWEETTVGEGENKKIVRTPKFVAADDPAVAHGVQIPQVDIDSETIMNFLRTLDGNDAIRDAAAQPGTVIVAPVGGNVGLAEVAALVRSLVQEKTAA